MFTLLIKKLKTMEIKKLLKLIEEYDIKNELEKSPSLILEKDGSGILIGSCFDIDIDTALFEFNEIEELYNLLT